VIILIYLWVACLVIWASISTYLLILSRREKNIREELEFLSKLLKEYEHESNSVELLEEKGNEKYHGARVKPS